MIDDNDNPDCFVKMQFMETIITPHILVTLIVAVKYYISQKIKPG